MGSFQGAAFLALCGIFRSLESERAGMEALAGRAPPLTCSGVRRSREIPRKQLMRIVGHLCGGLHQVIYMLCPVGTTAGIDPGNCTSYDRQVG